MYKIQFTGKIVEIGSQWVVLYNYDDELGMEISFDSNISYHINVLHVVNLYDLFKNLLQKSISVYVECNNISKDSIPDVALLPNTDETETIHKSIHVDLFNDEAKIIKIAIND